MNISSSKSNSTKKARFSDHSLLYVYDEDRRYANTKSYTSADKKRFSNETMSEVIRINELLRNSKGLSKPYSVPEEEIRGVEQFILRDYRRALKKRKLHIQTVLVEQANQTEGGKQDIYRLARISTVLAKKNVSQARERAARAA